MPVTDLKVPQPVTGAEPTALEAMSTTKVLNQLRTPQLVLVTLTALPLALTLATATPEGLPARFHQGVEEACGTAITPHAVVEQTSMLATLDEPNGLISKRILLPTPVPRRVFICG